MKNLLIILTFGLCLNIYSQNFDGYVVTNTNDTIKCSFDVQTNLFDSTFFYPSSVIKKVKVLTNSGEKIKFYPNQLKSFLIKNTKFGDFKFVSLKADNYKEFYEEKIVGKISFYNSYVGNMNGGSPISISFYSKEDELFSRETNFYNFRNWFGKLIADYPELHQKWMDSDTYYKKDQALEVLKLYNEHFKK